VSKFSSPRSFTIEQPIITLDDFETGVGHFINEPTYSGSTIGISSASTLERVTNASFGGVGSLSAILKDDSSVSSDWFVHLLSGSGIPENNTALNNYGIVTFWMKSKNASGDAMVQIQVKDSDGLETSPTLPVRNDDRWHKYSFDLASIDKSSVGNGKLDSPTVTLDAILLKQTNSTADWIVLFDDVEYNSKGTGTRIVRSAEDVTKEIPVISDKIPVIYPNPNNGILNINYPDSKEYTVEIINISGAKVFTSESRSSLTQIDMHNLPKGVYFVMILSDNAKEIHRLILDHK
jgi:hypothetical protein